MSVLSPAAGGHGYHNVIPSTLSSTLRTLEEIDGVRLRLRDAHNATDLSDLFAADAPGCQPLLIRHVGRQVQPPHTGRLIEEVRALMQH